MIRGTTAQFKFKLPYPKEDIDWITIKFWQKGSMASVTKTKTHCSTTDNPNEICVSLSPEQTAMFSEKYKGIVQFMAQPIFGSPFGSRQQLFTVYPMQDDLISKDPTPEPDVPPTEDGWIILDSGTVGV